LNGKQLKIYTHLTGLKLSPQKEKKGWELNKVQGINYYIFSAWKIFNKGALQILFSSIF
jgi:hypothetical protein